MPTVLAHRQFIDINNQLVLLIQIKLAFTGRNMLIALKIRRVIKKFKKQARRLFWPRSIHFCHQKPDPARETVPLRSKKLVGDIGLIDAEY
jgi:hypothetical protein